jgi:erythromycin esterase
MRLGITCLLLLLLQTASPPRIGIHPIRLAGEDFSDLEFLKTALGGVRIVQLGENGHGTSEAMQARERIARFLHAEMGFTVAAFESSLFLSYLADSRASEASPQRTIQTGLLGVWHTREMLPLFERIRDSRTSARPFRLAGFDIQPIGSNRHQRSRFFSDLVAPLDPKYAGEVLAFDTEFFAAYDKGSAARRQFLRANATSLSARYDALAEFIERNLVALQATKAGREVPLVAMQEARSAAAYVRFQAAPDMKGYAEARDRAMFENLRFIAEQLFTDQKIIVWGHNYHLRHDNAAIPPREEIFPGIPARSMGSWTKAHFGRRVFTIGQYEFEGEAFNNSRKPYTVGRPATGSLEARLNELSAGAASLVLLSQLPWSAETMSARYNGEHAQIIVPVRQYDAVLFLPKVKPPAFLY